MGLVMAFKSSPQQLWTLLGESQHWNSTENFIGISSYIMKEIICLQSITINN